MSAWDPHIDQSVAVRNMTFNGESHALFKPFNFTDQPFFLEYSRPSGHLKHSRSISSFNAFSQQPVFTAH